MYYQGCLVDIALGDCDCPEQPCKDVQADQDTCCPDMPKEKFLMFSQVKINKIFECKIINIFLPISFNICFGCSKERSH